jgi:uncharacterized protein (DUF1778 family)
VVVAWAEPKQMTSMKSTATKTPRETLNLRIPAAERHLIDRAATSAGKTRTDFILEAARKAAEEHLLDRALIGVGEEAYSEFLRRLDAPAAPNERLQRSMQTRTPWDKASC